MHAPWPRRPGAFLTRRTLLGGATGAAALLLSACVVAPLPGPGPAYGSAPDGSPVVVAPMAPPPPPGEAVVVAPGPGYIWIGGYWNWGGGRYVWAPGHWAAPRPGYRWVPRTWYRGPGGWHGRGGYWGR